MSNERTLSLIVFAFVCAGCINDEPPFECESRELPTTEVSDELMIGTWAGCPGVTNYELEDQRRPERIYCTFEEDGDLIRRRLFGSGSIDVRESTWTLNAPKQLLYLNDAEFEFVGVGSYSIKVLPIDIAATETSWSAVSCSGPGWSSE